MEDEDQPILSDDGESNNSGEENINFNGKTEANEGESKDGFFAQSEFTIDSMVGDIILGDKYPESRPSRELTISFRTLVLEHQDHVASSSLENESKAQASALKQKRVLVLNCLDLDIQYTVLHHIQSSGSAEACRIVLLDVSASVFRKPDALHKIVATIKPLLEKDHKYVLVVDVRHDYESERLPESVNVLIQHKEEIHSLGRDDQFVFVFLVRSSIINREVEKNRHLVVFQYWNIPFTPYLLESYYKTDVTAINQSREKIERLCQSGFWGGNSHPENYRRLKLAIAERCLEKALEHEEHLLLNKQSGKKIDYAQNWPDELVCRHAYFIAVRFPDIPLQDFDSLMDILSKGNFETPIQENKKVVEIIHRNADEQGNAKTLFWKEDPDAVLRHCGLITNEQGEVRFESLQLTTDIRIALEQNVLFIQQQQEKILSNGYIFRTTLSDTAKASCLELLLDHWRKVPIDKQLNWLYSFFKRQPPGKWQDMFEQEFPCRFTEIIIDLIGRSEFETTVSAFLQLISTKKEEAVSYLKLIIELALFSDFSPFESLLGFMDKKWLQENEIAEAIYRIADEKKSDVHAVYKEIWKYLPADEHSEDLQPSRRFALYFLINWLPAPNAVPVGEWAKWPSNYSFFSGFNDDRTNREKLKRVLKWFLRITLSRSDQNDQKSTAIQAFAQERAVYFQEGKLGRVRYKQPFSKELAAILSNKEIFEIQKGDARDIYKNILEILSLSEFATTVLYWFLILTGEQYSTAHFRANAVWEILLDELIIVSSRRQREIILWYWRMLESGYAKKENIRAMTAKTARQQFMAKQILITNHGII